jgi:phosphonate transport system permease protein
MANKRRETTWERPSAFYNKLTKYAVYTLIAVFFLWSFTGIEITIDRVLFGLLETGSLLERAWPPAWSQRYAELIWRGMYDSVGMAFWATTIGVVVSIPFAILGAENFAPKPVYYVSRGIMILSRTFHPLILGIIFVKAVGIGPFAGILTFVVGTVGYWSKLMAEDIENIDMGPMNAVRATGAGQFTSLIYGVVPQVLPRAVGLTIYRWDSNIRGSLIIGIVGAGGIGSTLLNSYQRYEYDLTLTILLVIAALVLLGEGVSARLRTWVK